MTTHATSTLSIGDLIVDNHAREGVVFAVERRPSAKWLSEQHDKQMLGAAGPWWKVFLLEGGVVIVPDDLGKLIRRATVDDVLRIADGQQSEHAGQVTVMELLQQLRTKGSVRA